MMLESQADFARRQGVNRSTVSRWRERGRLAMRGDQVDVSASLALLDNTRGDRQDVTDRHQMEREEKRAADEAGNDPQADGLREALRRAALEKSLNEGRIKAAQADKIEMERDQMAGDLIASDDVDYILRDYGALLRVMLDGRAERLGAEHGLTPDQIVSLSEADEHLLLEMADKLKARGVAEA